MQRKVEKIDPMAHEARHLVQRMAPLFNRRDNTVITFIAARSGEGTSTVSHGFFKTLCAEAGRCAAWITHDRTDESFAVEVYGGKGGAVRGDAFLRQWIAEDGGPSLSSRLIYNQDFWESLRGSFDIVVFDAPSLGASSDGITLASHSDYTVLVVEAEATPQPVIEHLRDSLVTAGVQIAGVVLNKRRFYIPQKVYRRL